MLSRARFAAGTLAAVAGVAAAPAARAQTLQSVGVLATPSDDMTPLLYAQKAGIFRTYGLDVTLTIATSGAASAAAVSSGAYAFGKSSLLTLLIAHEKGLPYTLVAASVMYDARAPYVAFVSAPSLEGGGKAFDGKLVGVSSLGDMGQIGLQAWVEARGGDPKALRFVEIPLSASMAAIDAGRVVAAEASEPVLAAALRSGKKLIPAYDVYSAKPYFMGGFFTTREYSQSHPEIVRNFARAWDAAARYTNAHHAETVVMVSDFTHVPPDVFQHMNRAIAGTALLPEQIQPVIEVAVRYGALKAPFPARELIDPNAAG